MNIVQDYPPNYDKIAATFKLSPGVVFTYGETIYNPSGSVIDPALLVHEAKHAQQQWGDPAGWWDRYLVDPVWRATQELAAYRVQYRKAKKIIRDREQAHRFLAKIAGDLSGPLYGNVISFGEAYRKIRM